MRTQHAELEEVDASRDRRVPSEASRLTTRRHRQDQLRRSASGSHGQRMLRHRSAEAPSDDLHLLDEALPQADGTMNQPGPEPCAPDAAALVQNDCGHTHRPVLHHVRGELVVSSDRGDQHERLLLNLPLCARIRLISTEGSGDLRLCLLPTGSATKSMLESRDVWMDDNGWRA